MDELKASRDVLSRVVVALSLGEDPEESDLKIAETLVDLGLMRQYLSHVNEVTDEINSA